MSLRGREACGTRSARAPVSCVLLVLCSALLPASTPSLPSHPRSHGARGQALPADRCAACPHRASRAPSAALLPHPNLPRCQCRSAGGLTFIKGGPASIPSPSGPVVLELWASWCVRGCSTVGREPLQQQQGEGWGALRAAAQRRCRQVPATAAAPALSGRAGAAPAAWPSPTSPSCSTSTARRG